MRQRRLGRQATGDQMRGGRSLGHPVGATAAGILRADGDDDAQLRGNDVEALGPVFADPVQRPAAAGAVQALGLDHHLDARQRGRQVADGAPRRGPGRCVLSPGPALGLLRLDLGEGDGQLLEGQLPLVFGELLRPFAMQGMVQLCDQMLLPARDLPKRGDLLDQRERRRTLRDRQGGKIQGGGGGHGLILPRSTHKNTQIQSVALFRSGWGPCFQRLDPAPVEPGKQRLELRVVQRHQAILDGRPGEAGTLQPLIGHHQTGTIPIQNLQPVRSARPKDEYSAGERILAQHR